MVKYRQPHRLPPVPLGRRAVRFVLGITVALTGLLAAAPAAHASPASVGCRALEITLNGSQHSSRCLVSNDSVSPMDDEIFNEACFGDARDVPYLELFWNGWLNVSAGQIPAGPTVCIRGNGYLNMNNIANGDQSWNDQATAWWAGCSSGHFDRDAGLFPGQQQYFSGGNSHWGNFDGGPGRLGNDSLTVVTLDSNC